MLFPVQQSPFRRVLLIFALLLSGSICPVCAATPTPTPTPGQLDTIFIPAPGTNDTVNVVIPHPRGKVIAAGRFTFANNGPLNRSGRSTFDGLLATGFNLGT